MFSFYKDLFPNLLAINAVITKFIYGHTLETIIRLKMTKKLSLVPALLLKQIQEKDFLVL